jgi:uncharacterized cupin superfamily protein
MSKLVVHRDTELTTHATTSGGGTAHYDDIYIDAEHEVTAVLWDADGAADGSRGFTELVVIVEGTGTYAIDGTEHRFGPGDFLVWPADVEATLTPDSRVRLLAVAYPFVRSE